MRARVLSAFLFIALLALFSGCAKKVEVPVRIGYLKNDLHQLPYYIAREKGYFDSEGVRVQEAGVFNTGPEEMSAFSAGELDMGYVGCAPAITFVAQDMASVKIVAQVNKEGSALVVRSGLEADDLSALKGRTIAIPGASTVQDFLISIALKRAKMKPEDVRIITLKPQEMLRALSSGQIDAFIAWEPYPSMAVLGKAGRILLSSRQIWRSHPCCVLVADSEFARKHGDLVLKVVKAHKRATKFINENFAEASDMAHLFTGQENDVVKLAMKNIEFSYTPSEREIEKYVDFLGETGVLRLDNKKRFLKDLIDAKFLKGAH